MFNLDADSFPIMPEGKFRRVVSCLRGYNGFWYSRREDRASQWGDFPSWDSWYPAASGAAIHDFWFNEDHNFGEEFWMEQFDRGPATSPARFTLGGTYLFLQVNAAFYKRAGMVDRDFDEFEEFQFTAARWFFCAIWQTLVAECLYKMIHYTPRPGAGNYGVE